MLANVLRRRWQSIWAFVGTSSTSGRPELLRSGELSFPGSGRKPSDQDSEIVRLKRELARVTEERDILKKAAAYFAKELP